ncbi:hypothetical protein ACGFX2_20970 [Streptomyces goshikiensis]|uniref:hypothetical protein n=1 Tax=Streptomyces goshikiensis TaxID=1942 RepID=UPI0037181549
MTTLSAAPALSSMSGPAVLSGRSEYEAALRRLREASQAYYGDGDSAMDDASYDRLRLALLAWETENPAEVAPGSPTTLVADGAAPAGDVAHTTRLLSLDNVFDAEGLVAWGASVERRLGRAPAGGFTVEPKIDGAAVAARYRGGRLVQIVTRGDGSHGEDVLTELT